MRECGIDIANDKCIPARESDVTLLLESYVYVDPFRAEFVIEESLLAPKGQFYDSLSRTLSLPSQQLSDDVLTCTA